MQICFVLLTVSNNKHAGGMHFPGKKYIFINTSFQKWVYPSRAYMYM